MRDTSVYCVDCLCGRHLESESTTLTCPACQRVIVIEWPVKVKEVQPSPAVKTALAA